MPPFKIWKIKTWVGGLFVIFMFSEIRDSLNGTSTFLPSWVLLCETMKSILPPFWLNLDLKWKIASPVIAIFSFNHYFTTLDHFLYGRLNVLVTKFENIVAKQNHHSFASHSLHFCIMISCMVYLEAHEWILGLKRKNMTRKKKGCL